jgi:hypothetical protein
MELSFIEGLLSGNASGWNRSKAQIQFLEQRAFDQLFS